MVCVTHALSPHPIKYRTSWRFVHLFENILSSDKGFKTARCWLSNARNVISSLTRGSKVETVSPSSIRFQISTCSESLNHMGASDSTLLGAQVIVISRFDTYETIFVRFFKKNLMDFQENRGGDVITTISHRSEVVDPVLENLKSLTVVSYSFVAKSSKSKLGFLLFLYCR